MLIFIRILTFLGSGDLGRAIFSVIILIDFAKAFINEIVILGLPDVSDHFLVFFLFGFSDMDIF